jgi:hypothetical protein
MRASAPDPGGLGQLDNRVAVAHEPGPGGVALAVCHASKGPAPWESRSSLTRRLLGPRLWHAAGPTGPGMQRRQDPRIACRWHSVCSASCHAGGYLSFTADVRPHLVIVALPCGDNRRPARCGQRERSPSRREPRAAVTRSTSASSAQEMSPRSSFFLKHS